MLQGAAFGPHKRGCDVGHGGAKSTAENGSMLVGGSSRKGNNGSHRPTADKRFCCTLRADRWVVAGHGRRETTDGTGENGLMLSWLNADQRCKTDIAQL